jgi:hypothetical protein
MRLSNPIKSDVWIAPQLASPNDSGILLAGKPLARTEELKPLSRYMTIALKLFSFLAGGSDHPLFDEMKSNI